MSFLLTLVGLSCLKKSQEIFVYCLGLSVYEGPGIKKTKTKYRKRAIITRSWLQNALKH